MSLVAVACATAPTTTVAGRAGAAPPPVSPVPSPTRLESREQPVLAVNASPECAIRLSRDAALLTALLNNPSIEVARFGPEIGDTLAPEARAAFDPALTASFGVGWDTRQLAPSSSTSQQSSTTGASSGSATTLTNPLQTTQELLREIRQLAVALDGTPTDILETQETQGMLGFDQLLPTGTQLSFTGTATETDTNLAGDDYAGAWTVALVQPLLRGAGTRVNLAALRMAKNQAIQSRHAFRSTVLDVMRQVETAYWGLVQANDVLKVREFAMTLADEQVRRVEGLLSVGKSIEGDVMAVRAEQASRKADLTDAQAAVRSQTLTLIRLLNPACTNRWGLTFEPADPPDVVETPLDASSSEQLAIQYRPELAEARIEVASLDLETDRARNALWPRLDVVGSYGRTSRGSARTDLGRHLDNADYDNYQVGLQLQAPILERAEKARYRRTRLTRDQAERSVARLELLLSTEARQAVIEVEKQWQRCQATKEAVTSRTEQLRVAQGRFEAGKTTNLDVLIVQRDFIQSQIDEVASRVRYIQALTALYAAEGTLLERRGVVLDTGEDS